MSRRRHRREYSATTDYVLIHGAWQTLDTLRRPEVDMHNRMKEALVLLGKLPRAVRCVRRWSRYRTRKLRGSGTR